MPAVKHRAAPRPPDAAGLTAQPVEVGEAFGVKRLSTNEEVKNNLSPDEGGQVAQPVSALKGGLGERGEDVARLGRLA